MMRKLVVIGLAGCTMMGTGGLSNALAQDSARAAVVGPWEGTISYAATWPASMEFSDDAGTLRWKASFKTTDKRFFGEAEGTVTSFSPPTLELDGAYTKHSLPNARGTRIKFTLTLHGNRMTGTAIPEINKLRIKVSMTKKQ